MDEFIEDHLVLAVDELVIEGQGQLRATLYSRDRCPFGDLAAARPRSLRTR